MAMHESNRHTSLTVDVDTPQQFRRKLSFEAVFADASDVQLLQWSLKEYQQSQSVNSILLQICSAFVPFGDYEYIYRILLESSFRGKADMVIPQAAIDRGADNKLLPPKVQKAVMWMHKSLEKHQVVYVDEDTDVMLDLLAEDTDYELSAVDLLKENIRARGEEMQLLKMQIDYSKRELRNSFNQKAQKPVFPKMQENPMQAGVAEEMSSCTSMQGEIQPEFAFPLSEWDVYWTKRSFSEKPQHLVSINTDSREEATKAIEKVGRGQISISPGSVLRALEFHVNSTVMEQAIRAQVKYGSEQAKKWVKIKRGDDRILLYVPNKLDNQLIFFAAGRDVVYRGL